MEKFELKREINNIENNMRLVFENVSDFIFKNPELGLKEHISSKYLVDLMKSYNFKTTYPYCGVDTAFLAEYGDDEGANIAFLAEYDALPGYGKNSDENAHACGHNWIAAATAGACIVLSKLKHEYNFKGKIILMGTPAEETIGSKVDIVNAGGFNNIDICIQPHIGEFTNICCRSQAMDSIEFKFKGKASHAAASPYEGINALDAVMLTFAGINALRQHIRSDVRIHGIVTEGGRASNIIPEKASCKIGTRAMERNDLDEITKRVIDIAKGADLMTGAKMSYEFFENKLDNLINVPPLIEITKINLEDTGFRDICYDGSNPEGGSSDLGNVSYACPTQYIEVALDIDENANVHEEAILKYVNSKSAYDMLHKIIKAMSGIAVDLYFNDEKVNEIKLWHKKRINEKNKLI